MHFASALSHLLWQIHNSVMPIVSYLIQEVFSKFIFGKIILHRNSIQGPKWMLQSLGTNFPKVETMCGH